MRNLSFLTLAGLLSIGLVISGCEQQAANDSSTQSASTVVENLKPAEPVTPPPPPPAPEPPPAVPPAPAMDTQAMTGQEAIDKSKALTPASAQVDYLINQAMGFLSQQKPNEAVTIAQYILTNVDQSSVAAKDILDKATAALGDAANSAVNSMTDSMNTMKDSMGTMMK